MFTSLWLRANPNNFHTDPYYEYPWIVNTTGWRFASLRGEFSKQITQWMERFEIAHDNFAVLGTMIAFKDFDTAMLFYMAHV